MGSLRRAKDTLIFVGLIPTVGFVWVETSIWAAYHGNADLFQRMGAYGVASAILRFGVERARERRGTSTAPPKGWSMERERDARHTLEVAMGFIGTLQAGFGDWFVNYLFVCGDYSC